MPETIKSDKIITPEESVTPCNKATTEQPDSFHRNEDGTINWKLMIPQEFLYVNSDPRKRDKIEKKYGKPIKTIKPLDDNVDDCDLISTLAAAKYLLRLRGYRSVRYNVISASENYAAVSCSILFLGNSETGYRDIEYSDNACAHQGNTTNFAQSYLLEIATNRALVRCIRSFLNISIVSKEELSDTVTFEEDQPRMPVTEKAIENFNRLLKSKNVSFKDVIKDIPGSQSWSSASDIPKAKLFEIIGKLNS